MPINMAKINYQNLPNTTTPLNATNLNAMQEISESGSNENGNYIKYQDGLLIQWGEVNLTTGTNSTTYGGCTIYTSDEVSQYYPIAFKDTDNVTVNTQVNGGIGYLNFIYTVIAAARVRIRLASTSSNLTRTIKWLAIGRWK